MPDANTLQQCASLAQLCGRGCQMQQSLQAGPTSGHWGYFYEGLRPAILAQSGDTLDLELPNSVGNMEYNLMVEGDPGIESLYKRNADGTLHVATVGAFGGGEGGHWLTGPVFVCGAQPGDVLQVDVLDIQPRPNPGKGNRTWGASWSGAHGWQTQADSEGC